MQVGIREREREGEKEIVYGCHGNSQPLNFFDGLHDFWHHSQFCWWTGGGYDEGAMATDRLNQLSPANAVIFHLSACAAAGLRIRACNLRM